MRVECQRINPIIDWRSHLVSPQEFVPKKHLTTRVLSWNKSFARFSKKTVAVTM
jgi:hypothetical protein